jgi:hypothetical protein
LRALKKKSNYSIEKNIVIQLRFQILANSNIP